MRLYDRLVTCAVDRRTREIYAVVESFANAISAIRRFQGRAADFQHYYEALLATYPRLSAFFAGKPAKVGRT